MGVDCVITLPANVAIRTVAKVLGRLLGCPATKEPLGGGTPGAWHVHMPGVSTGTIDSLPECCNINIAGATVDQYPTRRILYHFEFGPGGHRGIMPRSRAINIALGRGLVDFFGGSVDYADCDDEDADYSVPEKPDEVNHPEDNEPWQDLQERIMAVEPLTKAQIKACEPFAAYQD